MWKGVPFLYLSTKFSYCCSPSLLFSFVDSQCHTIGSEYLHPSPSLTAKYSLWVCDASYFAVNRLVRSSVPDLWNSLAWYQVAQWTGSVAGPRRLWSLWPPISLWIITSSALVKLKDRLWKQWACFMTWFQRAVRVISKGKWQCLSLMAVGSRGPSFVGLSVTSTKRLFLLTEPEVPGAFRFFLHWFSRDYILKRWQIKET